VLVVEIIFGSYRFVLCGYFGLSIYVPLMTAYYRAQVAHRPVSVFVQGVVMGMILNLSRLLTDSL
jgi:hypothetical protein